MKNQSGFPLWRLAPEPWIGLAIPYAPEFSGDSKHPNAPLRTTVETMAFDRQSKTWWMPRSYEPAVTSLVREYKGFDINDVAVDKARVEIYRDKVLFTGGESAASDYAMLSLHPSAPPQLVDWALMYWRNTFKNYGAPPTHLMQLEEAYSRICRHATQAAPQYAPGQPRKDQG